MAPSVPIRKTRNCCRCGRNFRAKTGKRICPACALPKYVERTINATLSFREGQVIKLISKGMLNKQIAWELHLTEGTVKEYLNHIFRKTATRNRTALAVWALTQPAAI